METLTLGLIGAGLGLIAVYGSYKGYKIILETYKDNPSELLSDVLEAQYTHQYKELILRASLCFVGLPFFILRRIKKEWKQKTPN